MLDPTLVVMAAGVGSRYGGLKQIDPVGLNGEIIIDYSIYDALKAGFTRIVFIIRRDMEAAFREKIGRTVEARADTAYVFQELSRLPEGFAVPAGRTKPWGTAHAVLSCKEVVRAPFVVINSDDFYGATAFQVMADYVRQAKDRAGTYDCCMVGYRLANTLSEHGHVARGICAVTPDGYLVDVRERTRIQQFEDGVKYTEDGATWVTLSPDSTVSLNTWGFTPGALSEFEARFPLFLRKNAANLAKAEYFLPEVVGDLVRQGKAQVRVLPTQEKWYGVTYQEDRPRVQAAIREMIRRGVYPERLWDSDR